VAHGIPDMNVRSRIRQWIGPALILIVAVFLRPAFGQFAEKKMLTLAAAQKMVEAAQHEAERNHLAGVIAVVDDGGWPILVLRMDHAAFVASVELAPGSYRGSFQEAEPSAGRRDQSRTDRGHYRA
jgi:glc operon protein GlcG